MSHPAPARRAVVRGAAWTIPVVATMATAPAFASSADPITGFIEALKCPGNSTPGVRDAVVVAFRTRSEADAQTLAGLPLDAWTITGNGTTWDVKRVTLLGGVIYVVTVPRGNSANAAGSLSVDYTINGQAFSASFTYGGTSPDHDICGRV